MITQVAPNLFRGPRPTEDELKQFKFDVNLEEGWFEFFHGLVAEERRWCADLGVTYLHRPMSDILSPFYGQVKTLIWEIQGLVSKGPTLVHCLHGEDRTGIMIAAWRILVEKQPVAKATAEMYQMGFHRFPYFYWVPVLTELKA